MGSQRARHLCGSFYGKRSTRGRSLRSTGKATMHRACRLCAIGTFLQYRCFRLPRESSSWTWKRMRSRLAPLTCPPPLATPWQTRRGSARLFRIYVGGCVQHKSTHEIRIHVYVMQPFANRRFHRVHSICGWLCWGAQRHLVVCGRLYTAQPHVDLG